MLCTSPIIESGSLVHIFFVINWSGYFPVELGELL